MHVDTAPHFDTDITASVAAHTAALHARSAAVVSRLYDRAAYASHEEFEDIMALVRLLRGMGLGNGVVR